MDIFNQVSEVSEHISPLLKVFGALLPVIAAVYVVYKTKSFHIIAAALWHIIGKILPSKDAQLNAFIEDRNAVMKFRSIVGIHARTSSEMKRIITWVKRNDLDIDEVKRCGSYFKVKDKISVAAPRKGIDWLCGIPLAILTVIISFDIAFAIDGRAFFQIKESKTWFAMDLKAANSSILLPKLAITAESCKAQDKIKTDLSNLDLSVVCEALTVKGRKEIIDSALEGQRMIFAFIFVYFTSILIAISLAYLKAEHARRLIRKLDGISQ
ncbi:DUF6216 family protein [Chromobacterium violaceum]|uniref:DUF6216 family protein n=1 Tax=Chromobacterium violaceum TaxID=536 RepID=UPI0012D2CA6E|nr:DUF6216 family protein [Chromobacterium violaceum]